MQKHSSVTDLIGTILYIVVGGLLTVALFFGWGVAKASDLHADYLGSQCQGRVVTARYYEDDVHVGCDVVAGQQLNMLLPRGINQVNALYLADQFGGHLVGKRLVVDIDF